MPTLPPRTIHNLADLFEFRCRQQPNELAYALIRDTLELEIQLTYGQLERRVRSLAGHLAREFAPGTKALLLYPQGLDAACAFWACVCAGLVPVPAPAPDPIRRKYALPRLRSIIEDAQVALALTTSSIRLCLRSFPSPTRRLRSSGWRRINLTILPVRLSHPGLQAPPLRTCNILQGRRPFLVAS